MNGKAVLLPHNVQILFERETVSEELENVSDKMIKEMKLEALMKMHPYDLSGGEQQKALACKNIV